MILFAKTIRVLCNINFIVLMKEFLYFYFLCDKIVCISYKIFSRDYDGKVTPEEVAFAAMYLKDTLGKEGIQELISNLSKEGSLVGSSGTPHLASYRIMLSNSCKGINQPNIF